MTTPQDQFQAISAILVKYLDQNNIKYLIILYFRIITQYSKNIIKIKMKKYATVK